MFRRSIFFDRIGAKRRKTAKGSPQGERSKSINRIGRREKQKGEWTELWMTE